MDNIKEIKSVTFVCENCEYVEIPIENFTKLNISKVDNEYYNFECIIEGMDNIEYHSFTNDFSPFNRLSMSDDIVRIELELIDGTIKLIRPVWEGTDFNNYCQESCLLKFNKIKIDINKEVKQIKIKRNIGEKAMEMLDYIYQDIGIDSCNDCAYCEPCKKMKQNKDVDVCDVLYFLSNSYENN